MTKGIQTLALMISIFLVPGNFIACKEVPKERAVVEIVLKGSLPDPQSEVSGLAWYNDHLIILPQYPGRFASKYDGKFFTIPKKAILSYLDALDKNKTPPPIGPRAIDFIGGELYKKMDNFEGFEAIGFWGNRVFIVIEASPGQMVGYLVVGEIAPDLGRITLINRGKPVKIQPQTSIPNASYETLLVTGDKVIVIFEGNGENINVSPLAHIYDHDLDFIHSIAFPNIEYRVTDATAMDKNNRFWCINYCWPDAREKIKYKPAEDPIAKKYGKGKTHAVSEVVERLVEFQYIDLGENKTKYSRVVLVEAPPIQVELSASARNWEGVVRLDNRGFLIVADEHPRTILAFVKK